MSFTCDTIWPIRIDLSANECRQILREKELLCYSDVVSVLRAQGPLSDEKKSVLNNLQKLLSISDERNRAELRRAANNEKLATIAETVSGFDAYAEWASLGALKMPPTKRPVPRTIYCDEASQTVADKYDDEKMLAAPNATSDLNITEKIEDAIATNRIAKVSINPATFSVAVNTECIKSTPKKEGAVSLEYNLHLLSEIATGESTQSGLNIETGDIKPDLFSIQHQIDDIELPISMPEQTPLVHSRHPSNSHVSMTPTPTNVYMPSKNISTIGHETQSMSINQNSSSMVIGNNSAGQRYVLPRNTMTQGINLISTNSQRSQVPGYIGQQQQQQQSSQANTYLAMANNQMRSPPPHQLGTPWSAQPQAQQFYIQNVSSHHGLGIQHNVSQSTMENLTALGHTLQQRAVRNEQHQTNNKQNIMVRNLGSQPSMDPERNKRFMVVKGGSSLGPSTKKPKISNPSNRQPGRPPLMPAPSSAYTSRPYVANEIFHTNRTSINAISSISDSPMIDSNGLKISSVISSGNSSNTSSSNNSNSNSNNIGTSRTVRPNSYYSVSRGGNGVQRTSGGANSSNVLQFGSGSHLRATEANTAAGNSSNTLRPKNIQPIISVVPLSPRGQSMNDSNITANVSILSTCVKEENSDDVSSKESIVPVKVIKKSEMYANLLDRINSPARLSSMHQSENKTQQHDVNISDIS